MEWVEANVCRGVWIAYLTNLRSLACSSAAFVASISWEKE